MGDAERHQISRGRRRRPANGTARGARGGSAATSADMCATQTSVSGGPGMVAAPPVVCAPVCRPAGSSGSREESKAPAASACSTSSPRRRTSPRPRAPSMRARRARTPVERRPHLLCELRRHSVAVAASRRPSSSWPRGRGAALSSSRAGRLERRVDGRRPRTAPAARAHSRPPARSRAPPRSAYRSALPQSAPARAAAARRRARARQDAHRWPRPGRTAARSATSQRRPSPCRPPSGPRE
jgi:hypothetical protein